MLHSQSSPVMLLPNQKKRRISTTKTKQSGQKVTPSPQHLTHKLSHKQSKSKHILTQIDEQQYKASIKRIHHLNDRSFLEMIEENRLKQATKILNEIKELIELSAGDQLRTEQEISLCSLKCVMLQQGLCITAVCIELCKRLGDFEESAKLMEEAIRNFQNFQGYILSREENLVHTYEWVKLYLQYFTTLSNINKHLQAIVSAQKCIQKISESFRILDAICTQNLVYSDTPQTIATQTQSRVKTQKVNFKRIVIKEAQKMLKEIDISSPHKLLTQKKEKFQQKLKNMYFWKNNLENNVKMAQKELTQKGKSSSNRNLLGVQKSSNFTEEFSLGELMNLGTRRMKEKLNTDQYFLISSPKIVELVLFASVCYFTIATETRFKEIDSDINSLKITEKYQRLNKDEIIFKCKVLHLKAIELAAKYLPQTSSYFTHILNSFNKNYKSILDQINEESESSMKSYNQSMEKYKKQIESEKEGLNQEYGMRNVHSNNNLHLSSRTHKRQMAQKMEKLEKSNSILPKMIKKRTLSKDKPTLSKRKVSITKK